MKKLIFRLLLLTIITFNVSCSNENFLEKYNCKIVDTKLYKRGNATRTDKKTIYVQIPEQLTEKQLNEIATQLKEENSTFKMLFISYLLPNMKISNYGWATTNYTPDLKISINGVSKKIEDQMKSINLPNGKGEIIGKWYNNSPSTERSTIIYKVDEKYQLREIRGKGLFINDKKLEYSNVNGKSKFVYQNDEGEYLLIENDGKLGIYDNNGLIWSFNSIK